MPVPQQPSRSPSPPTADLDAAMPATDAPPGFPVPLDAAYGREADAAGIAALLTEGGARLVTLTGPGGVGKTRLALLAAPLAVASFRDGATWVGLGAMADPALASAAVAEALGVEDAAAPLPAALARLATEQRLLVLDNLEHLPGVHGVVSDLLAAGPGVAVLATSRRRLRLPDERVAPVAPLPVPDPDGTPRDRLADSPAVRLFAARARAVDPAFALGPGNLAAVAGLCARLDGLPLAIELAAARARVLSPAALLARLDDRLGVLARAPGDRPERHRTMHAAIAWSYDALPPDQQGLFRRLAVFAGGFAAAAAEDVSRRVAAARGRDGSDGGPVPDAATPRLLDSLEALLDAALLRREPSPPGSDDPFGPRLGLLETVRAFGLEVLADNGEADAVRAAHAAWCLDLAERAEVELTGADQLPWFARLETERPNLRAALRWLIDRGEAEPALRLAGALGLFWTWPPYQREGRDWLEAVLAMPGADEAPTALAKALNAAGVIAEWQSDYPAARAWLERSFRLRDGLGDQTGAAEVLGSLGNVALGTGDLDGAEAAFADALGRYRDLGHAFWEAETLSALGNVAAARGDHRTAAAWFRESVAAWRGQSGPVKISDALELLGWSCAQLGDLTGARAAYAEALALEIAAEDDLRIGRCARGAAALAFADGNPALAARLLAADAGQREAMGAPLRPAVRAEVERLVDAVRTALGAAVFAARWSEGRSMPIAEAAAWAADVFARRAAPVADPYGLTPRERDVLRLVVAGRADKEIAAALGMTRRTASAHVSAILSKLGAPSRTAAATIALRDGLA